MKKQETTKKLGLNKFKIASISNFGKRKILGGEGDDPGDRTTTDRPTVKTTIGCEIINNA